MDKPDCVCGYVGKYSGRAPCPLCQPDAWEKKENGELARAEQAESSLEDVRGALHKASEVIGQYVGIYHELQEAQAKLAMIGELYSLWQLNQIDDEKFAKNMTKALDGKDLDLPILETKP